MMEPIYGDSNAARSLNIYFELAADFYGLDLGALWQDVRAAGRLGRLKAPLFLAGHLPAPAFTNDPGDGGLVAEASQEPQLAFEGGRGVRAAGDRDHERCGDPGCVDRKRLIEELLVVAPVSRDGASGFRI
jgi:hypothetical protein